MKIIGFFALLVAVFWLGMQMTWPHKPQDYQNTALHSLAGGNSTQAVQPATTSPPANTGIFEGLLKGLGQLALHLLHRLTPVGEIVDSLQDPNIQQQTRQIVGQAWEEVKKANRKISPEAQAQVDQRLDPQIRRVINPSAP